MYRRSGLTVRVYSQYVKLISCLKINLLCKPALGVLGSLFRTYSQPRTLLAGLMSKIVERWPIA
jgi:hypothetical protein